MATGSKRKIALIVVCVMAAAMLVLSGCSTRETSEALDRIDQEEYNGQFFVDDSFVDEKVSQIKICDTLIPATYQKAAEIEWETKSLRFPGVAMYQLLTTDNRGMIQVKSPEAFVEIVGETADGEAVADDATYTTYYKYANAEQMCQRYLDEREFTITPVSSEKASGKLQSIIDDYVAARVSGEVSDGFIDSLKAQGATVKIVGSEGSYFKRTDDVVNPDDKAYQSELVFVTTALKLDVTMNGETKRYIDWDIPFSVWYLVQPNDKQDTDFTSYFNAYRTVAMNYGFAEDLFLVNELYGARVSSELAAQSKTSAMKDSLATALLDEAKASGAKTYDFNAWARKAAAEMFPNKAYKNFDGATVRFVPEFATVSQRDYTYCAMYEGDAPGSYIKL